MHQLLTMRLTLRNLFRFAVQTQTEKKTSTAQNYTFAKDIPSSVPREHMNLYQSINSAIDVALATDPTYF